MTAIRHLNRYHSAAQLELIATSLALATPPYATTSGSGTQNTTRSTRPRSAQSSWRRHVPCRKLPATCGTAPARSTSLQRVAELGSGRNRAATAFSSMSFCAFLLLRLEHNVQCTTKSFGQFVEYSSHNKCTLQRVEIFARFCEIRCEKPNRQRSLR